MDFTVERRFILLNDTREDTSKPVIHFFRPAIMTFIFSCRPTKEVSLMQTSANIMTTMGLAS